MSYASAFEEEMGGLDVDQLPPELREQARKEKQSQGGYRYDSPTDKQHIKEQRAAIWSWFRGLGGNLIKHGVNLTKVPLPVELCEPRSFLQRLTDSWSYTDLLHAAAACSDHVERLKLVVAFAVGGMRQQVSCDKPFNPILGETLQGSYPCGCTVYAEQVSHHPPISCWQMLDHNGQFEYTGSSCWSATFTGNSVKGIQYGDSQICFASDGAVVTWTLPTIHIRGVLFGDRVVKYHDTIVFEDKKNGLRCELSIDPHVPKKGLVKRIIGKARHPRSKAGHDQLLGDLVRLGPSGKQVVLDNLAGTWLTELTWDKGVRSTIMPTLSQAAFEANAPVAAASAASAVAPAAFQQLHVDDDAASLGCHSIGSFSTTSSSSLSNVEGLDGLGANEAGEGNSSSGSSSSSEPINNRKLTVGALAAHTQKIATSLAAGGSAAGPQPNGSAACVAAVASAATVSSSDAAHRSGRGIRVVKKLWAAKTSQVWKFIPLADDDPSLLASDYRYRPDVQALAGGARNAAQHWKLVLEERQRKDRALREQGGFYEQGGHHNIHHRHSTNGNKQGNHEELHNMESTLLARE